MNAIRPFHAAALIAVVLFSFAIVAQERESILPPPIDNKECLGSEVIFHGKPDNFGGGPDATTPSPALAAMLSTLHPATYDVDLPNKNFGDSFRVCLCRACTAKVEIRVRKVSPPNTDLPKNDAYSIGVAPS